MRIMAYSLFSASNGANYIEDFRPKRLLCFDEKRKFEELFSSLIT